MCIFQKFQYINSSRFSSAYDSKRFDRVIHSLGQFGFDENQKMKILKVLSAILHIGNVEFHELDNTNGVRITESSKEHLNHAAVLLDITDTDSLTRALSERTIKINSCGEETVIKCV